MMTFRSFEASPQDIPAATAWYLADLGEARGRQELFRRQFSPRLMALGERAIIESAVSSNRIEGVEVDQSRIQTILFGRSQLRDRNEEEVRGYRNALKLIHEHHQDLELSAETIKKLHRIARAGIGDAGEYKQRDTNIIERYPNGSVRVRFRTVPASQTAQAMGELVDRWKRSLRERWIHPLAALAAFSLDFLCIHPFRDGNGRVARLLLLLQCHHLGYEVGRYISVERLIEQNVERYYETLELGSERWHEGSHDPWPHIGYLLFILKEAYRELEERVAHRRRARQNEGGGR